MFAISLRLPNEPPKRPARKRGSASARSPSLTHRIRVGDQVKILFGMRPVPAIVIEDRGDYGTPPTQLVRVRWLPAEAEEPEEFEISAQDVELVPA